MHRYDLCILAPGRRGNTSNLYRVMLFSVWQSEDEAWQYARILDPDYEPFLAEYRTYRSAFVAWYTAEMFDASATKEIAPLWAGLRCATCMAPAVQTHSRNMRVVHKKGYRPTDHHQVRRTIY